MSANSPYVLRAQVLHMETISMMTKYQLVFTKMEGNLMKIGNTIEKQYQLPLSFSSEH